MGNAEFGGEFSLCKSRERQQKEGRSTEKRKISDSGGDSACVSACARVRTGFRASPRKKNIFVSFRRSQTRPARLAAAAAAAALNFLNNYRGYELDSSPKFAFLRCFICASQSQRN